MSRNAIVRFLSLCLIAAIVVLMRVLGAGENANALLFTVILVLAALIVFYGE